MKKYEGIIQQKLSTFLLQYRKAPNATTTHSPTMLFLKGEIRTREANLKWRFGKIANRDGVLHYTVEVQGILVRRHVDQIHPVGDHVQKNYFIPNVHRRFSAANVRESNSNLQHTENPSSRVPNEEQGPSFTSAVPSNDVPAHDSPTSDVQLDSFSMRSPPVLTSPSQVPRHSGRIRRPPKRLDL
ncbi:hypothetical protein AVEN_221593-1 [Araneus ventricosus]|uniref:Uncharacterized protein n=1 Tax=Araneus ventricosus TaxID=182803 RepID=A0A4Y2PQ69_ARAVE|nr:hypothetical protein AVEN_221593-1 [Araneus ventricosus]